MNDQDRIVLMLDALGEMQAQRDLIRLDQQAAIDSVLTPEIKARIAEIEAEFTPKAEALGQNMAELEGAIKAQVIGFGESVRGARLQAVWSKARVSWNTKALDGYAAAHPEMLAFRSEGEPSVSIRQVK